MNIVDYVTLGILGISILFGMYRGFISTVLNTGAALISFVTAFLLQPRLIEWIQGSEETVRTLMHYTDASSRLGDLELSLRQVVTLGSDGIAQIVERAKLPEPLSTLLAANMNGQVWKNAGLTTVSEYVSQTILTAIMNILCFLACFILIYLLLSILINLLKSVFHFPLLKVMDWLAGGTLGLFRGVLLCYVVFAVVPLVLTIVPVDFVQQLLDESTLAPVFNNGTLLLSIMNGSL